MGRICRLTYLLMYRLPHGRLMPEASRSDELDAMGAVGVFSSDSSSLGKLRAEEGRLQGRGYRSSSTPTRSLRWTPSYSTEQGITTCISTGLGDGVVCRAWDDRWQEGRLLRSRLLGFLGIHGGDACQKGRKDCRVRRRWSQLPLIGIWDRMTPEKVEKVTSLGALESCWISW